MAANFPDNPTVGDQFEINGRYFTWTGEKWARVRIAIAGAASNIHLSGDIVVDQDAYVDGDLTVLGHITVPTQPAGTNDTKVATTEFVTNAVASGGESASSEALVDTQILFWMGI